ncbi:hypothetical protein DFH09DRAFT_1312699 [Mycena vulgaris]|nr:hypothetical protein DFH09DRAFT_1312699 [Mycena vulgaris]
MSTFRSLAGILVHLLHLTRHLLSDTITAAYHHSFTLNLYSTASAHSPFRRPSPLKSLSHRLNSLTARPTFTVHPISSIPFVGGKYPLALPQRKLLTLAPPRSMTLTVLARTKMALRSATRRPLRDTRCLACKTIDLVLGGGLGAFSPIFRAICLSPAHSSSARKHDTPKSIDSGPCRGPARPTSSIPSAAHTPSSARPSLLRILRRGRDNDSANPPRHRLRTPSPSLYPRCRMRKGAHTSPARPGPIRRTVRPSARLPLFVRHARHPPRSDPCPHILNTASIALVAINPIGLMFLCE